MNQLIVTFIIPCYNVSTCVEHCLQSILQPEVLDRIEVLTVNDGSKDDTLTLLRRYEQQYPNTMRVLDKPNGGWGTAINLAVKEAKGKYVKEVDADDWVENQQLKNYIDRLKQLDCDYIATEYTEYFKADDKYEHHTYQKEIYDQTISLSDFWERYPKAWDFPIHAITYRTKMLHDIEFAVGDRYYGDIEYNLYPLPYVRTICVLPINVTIYFRGSDEQSTSTKGYAKHYKDFAQMSQRITHFFHRIPAVHPNLYRFIESTVKGSIVKSYNLMMSPIYAGRTEGVKEELKRYDRWLKNSDHEIYRYCGKQLKHGFNYIRIWRLFRINLMKIKTAGK